MEILTLAMFAQTIRISVPYVLASLGGTFSERAGVVNIALEGIMLNGAFCSILTVYYTNNAWWGIIGGIGGGFLTAAIHALVAVKYKADQIVSGVAINLFAMGITKFVLRIVFGSSSNSSRVEGLPTWHVPVISSESVWHTVLGSPMIWLTAILIGITHIVLFKTAFGLRLRSVGEHPEAADTLGISVPFMRYCGVFISGIFAGLAGAYLGLEQHQFTDNMTSGRGYIALAAMIFGKWTPLGAAGASLLFGFAESLNIQLQSAGYGIPNQFIQIMPYILTMIVLAGVIGRAIPPACIGKPYEKE